MISFQYFSPNSIRFPIIILRWPTQRGYVRPNTAGNRSLLFVASGILLLSFLSLFYGCSEQDSQRFSSDSEKGAFSEEGGAGETIENHEESFDSVTPPTPSGPPVLSEEDLAGLRDATESFSENFQENGVNSASSADRDSFSEEKNLDVADEIQERYSRLPDLTFAPKIAERNDDQNAQRHILRYRFDPGTDQRWNVSHRVWKKVLMAGHETEVETVSSIVRRWRVGQVEEIPLTPEEMATEGMAVDPGLNFRYEVEYFIDEMDLEQHETGKDPVIYDSRTDDPVPPEFAYFGTEKAVGTALERMKIDSFGMMTEKVKLVREFGGAPKDSRVMFPFPEEGVAVGETWTLPYTLFLTNRDKTVKTVNAIQKFTLENVTGGIATIRVKTVTTSIIGDPYLDGQLAERLFTGTCRFDISRGKTLKTEIEFARTVPEAYGHASFLDYRCRVVEEWVRE